MWWLLKVLIFVVLLVVLVLVAIGNVAPVDVNLLLWETQQVPLFLVMLGAAIFGLVAGLAVAGVREVQWRVRIGKHQKQHQHLEREVHDLRRGPLKGLDEPTGVGDPAGSRPKRLPDDRGL